MDSRMDHTHLTLVVFYKVHIHKTPVDKRNYYITSSIVNKFTNNTQSVYTQNIHVIMD